MPGVSLPDHRYSHTEATRLLCAGVYQDAAFRRRVIEELVDRQERPVAPALGVDVLPVLSHAVRITRQESRTALVMFLVWCGFFLSDVVMFWDSLADRRGEGAVVEFGDVVIAFYLGDDRLTAGMPMPWSQFYAFVALALWFADSVSNRGADALAVGLPQPVARAADSFGRGIVLGALLFTGFYWCWYVVGVLSGGVQTPYPLIFPLLIAIVGWWHQAGQREALCRWLSRGAFPTVSQPALPDGPLYEDLRDSIRREQEAALTLYDADSPFVGLGSPRRGWSSVMELRRRSGNSGGSAAQPPPAAADSVSSADGIPLPRQVGGPLTAEAALDMIERKLQRLRESVEASGKDRLRGIEVERFVYLPGGVGRDEDLDIGGTADSGVCRTGGDRRLPGLPVYDRDQVAAHLREAVDEGGEGRRVFLRIRIGAWHENVVVTVLVRVHTQGGMLVLEVQPYVLGPVRKEFRSVDDLVDKLPETWGRGALQALRHAPTIGLSAVFGALGTLRRELGVGGPNHERPDVPRVSLRSLAGTTALSPLQEMDVTRYIKTVEERIASGMLQSLHERGYHTEQFEQHIYQVSGGSVFIQDMSGGAVATGSHGSASHTAHRGSPHVAPRADLGPEPGPNPQRAAGGA